MEREAARRAKQLTAARDKKATLAITLSGPRRRALLAMPAHCTAPRSTAGKPPVSGAIAIFAIFRPPGLVGALWPQRRRPSAIVGLLTVLLVLPLLGAPAAHSQPLHTSGRFKPEVFPVVGPRVSSLYGMRVHPILKFSRLHQGIDLAAPAGSPIRAVASGVVVFADPYAGYGNLVVVAHPSGVTTHYGHCEKLLVKPGMRIRAGHILALVGSTGHSTGPHLHFEVRINGEARDPEDFLQGFDAKAQG